MLANLLSAALLGLTGRTIRVEVDVAPGLPGTFEFHATASGRFEVRADEMCGLPHPEQFVGAVVVESADAYRAWVRERMKKES